jgi:hypothetical protein
MYTFYIYQVLPAPFRFKGMSKPLSLDAIGHAIRWMIMIVVSYEGNLELKLLSMTTVRNTHQRNY